MTELNNKDLYNSVQKHSLGVLQSRELFRRAGARYDTINPGFSDTDTPATLYFKIFFCFRNGRLLDITAPRPMGFSTRIDGGALTPSENSALNFLYTNGEFERANMLKQFVLLLQNISMYSPWYFQSINGLDQLMMRTELGNNEFNPVQDEPKGITIKCLEDAYDQRIGTLLDLYKSACFSQQLHKEIVPANLRKFDMIIYLFSTPIKGVRGNLEQSSMKDTSDRTILSSKMIELKNCELSIGSNSTAYSDLSNVEGVRPEYTIAIKCDALYEQRYNKLLNTYIGDLVEWDINYNETVDSQKEKYDHTDWITENLGNMLAQEAQSNLGDNRAGDLGTVKVSRMMQKFGIQNMVDKVGAKINDLVEKFNPISNGKALVNEGISTLQQKMNDAVSDITFGNIYDEKWHEKGLSGLIDDIGKGDKSGRTSPTSSVGQNIYKGWTKS